MANIGTGFAGELAGRLKNLIAQQITLTDPDVAHGMTGNLPTNAFGLLKITSGTDGGLSITGASDAAGQTPLTLIGVIGVADPTDTTAAIILNGYKKSGVGYTDLGAAETVEQLKNGATNLRTVLGSGLHLIGDTSNANSVIGLTLNQGANDDEILTFKSSDIAHTVTTETEADTYALFKKYSATAGGLLIRGLTDVTADGALVMEGIIGATDPTDTHSALLLIGSKQTGTTTVALGDAETVLRIVNRTNNLLTVLGNGYFGWGTVTPDRLTHAEISDAVTNAVTYAQRLSHITSGTAAANFGVGIEFELENANANGTTNKVASTIEAIWTDATDASEDSAIVFKNMIAGAAAAEVMRITDNGVTISRDWVGLTELVVQNTSDTGAEYAQVRFYGNQTSSTQGTDLQISFMTGSGGTDWALGIDRSEGGLFKISGGTNHTDDIRYPLGTNDRFVIDVNGNIGIATQTFGTNAAKALGMINGTAPTTSPADMFQMWSADFLGTAGDARMHIMAEGSASARVVLGSGKVTNQGTTGGYTRQLSEATATLSGASTVIQVNIPSGAKLHAVQFRVDTAITSGDGATSWSAAYSGGSSTSLVTGQAFAQNTKANKIHVDEIASSEVDITITPDSGTFSGGVIRAIAIYEDVDTMANAA